MRFARTLVVVLLVGATAAVVHGLGGSARAGPFVYSPQHHNPDNAVIAVRTRQRLVGLSFDDGPSPRFTPTVLKTLRRYGAHATFFDVGTQALTHKALVRAELASGNEVGNHTLDHPLLRGLSPPRILAEITRGQAAIEHAGAPTPQLFRPPHGYFDEAAGAAARADGERMVGWNAVIEKALHGRTPAAAGQLIARQVAPGSIILAHDGRLNRERTVRALGPLLAALHRRGLRAVTVSTLLRAAS
jgi:peptidoglycan/xylan/chitin deacetylase (PgdA/CDA1 family)